MVLSFFVDRLQFHDTVVDIVLFGIRVSSVDGSETRGQRQLAVARTREKSTESRAVQIDSRLVHNARDARFHLVVRLSVRGESGLRPVGRKRSGRTRVRRLLVQNAGRVRRVRAVDFDIPPQSVPEKMPAIVFARVQQFRFGRQPNVGATTETAEGRVSGRRRARSVSRTVRRD